MKLFVAAAVLAAVAQAQDLGAIGQAVAGLPQCGQTCIQNMLGLAASLGCTSPTDIKCLCSNKNFGYGVRDCSNAVCSPADAQKTIQTGLGICAQFASGAASSAGASASSVISSASSAASDASASASSVVSGASSSASSVSASASMATAGASDIGGVAAGAIGTATTVDSSSHTELIVTYTSGGSTLQTTVSLPSNYMMSGASGSMTASSGAAGAIAGAIGTSMITTNGATEEIVTFTSGGSTMATTFPALASVTMSSSSSSSSGTGSSSSSSGSGSSSGMSTSTAKASSSSSGSGAFQTQAPLAAAIGMLGLIAAL